MYIYRYANYLVSGRLPNVEKSVESRVSAQLINFDFFSVSVYEIDPAEPAELSSLGSTLTGDRLSICTRSIRVAH